MGYYPALPISNKIVTASEIGWFFNNPDINKTGTVDLRGINMALYGSAGVNIPFGYYSNVMIGPEISIGFSDLMNHINTYRDIFDNAYEHKPTKVKYFGLRISFAYKL